jgi:two-component system, chemotaxis family, sensor kinase CheA
LNAEISAELLDDFFTECDEHLTHIRKGLVDLEPSIGKAQPDRTIVEELLRSFHSFKGISAIVGLRAAEELAHATEDYLRELTRGSVTLSAETLELLMLAAQRLEKVATAFRSKQTIPANDQLVEDLRAASGKKGDMPTAQPSAGAIQPTMDEARSRGMVLWKFSFTPTQELDARGVNINSVRARLGGIGEILQAAPHVRGKGSVVFEFVVAMKETPTDIALWEADGLKAELAEQPKAEHPALEEHNPFIAPSHVVRVDLPRLDDLIRIVGEMVIKRSRFEEEVNRLSRKGEALDIGDLREINIGFARSLRELREAIMRVRMVSVAEIFARMPFVVRDLARESHKKARLAMEGQQTEVDKYLIEQLKDPLLHLVRNSFSHGVETPEERRKAGKAEEAVITLTAMTSGDSVIISVGDDGRGIDKAAVLARANELGIATPEFVDNTALLEILCSPGFSTRVDADRASGRGVGMSVVHTTVRALGGTLSLETAEGAGTRFVIRVPLTLAIAETFIVSAANHTCAMPQSFVTEILQATEDEIRRVNGVEVITYREGVLPVLRLASFFRAGRHQSPKMCILVLNSDRGSAGLAVDRIHGQREVVVRPIRDPLIQSPGVAGATELGDGRPVLILDGAAFTSGAVRPNIDESELEKN